MRNRYVSAGVALMLLLALVMGINVINSIVSISAGSRVKVMSSEEAGIDWVTDAQKLEAGDPIVRYPARSGVSSHALRDYPAIVTPKTRKDENWHEPRRIGPGTPATGEDTTVQSILSPLAMPTPIQNFDGMYNLNGYIPPDTNGDVGRNQYVQTVNSTFQVFSKTGASLYGPANINVLWTGFGGRCEADNDGDPIAIYDSMAGRWIISQFSTATPSHQCIAVSASEDATGTYYLYDYVSGPTAGAFEDYPHFGVWPDAYYMASNEFGGPNGGGNFAFERQRMIQGDPTARMVFFGSNDSGLLPSDLDGALPPAGSPNYFVTYPTLSSLAIYKFHVDWTTPANSTFTGPTTIPVTPFSTSIGSVPQLGTSVRVDSLGDRLMYRLAYRNFGSHESLALNFTVATGGVTAPRWYEIRNPNGTPTVFQEGTYAPADGIFRWMGSITFDQQGNMAMGFSASNASMFPDIRYTGRLVTDPVGQMSQGETIMHAGGGSETNAAAARWGDYSSLSIDPADDCTFWFTTEYFAQTGPRNWRTRIGSFKFPGCTGTPSTPVPTATALYPSPTPPAATPTACANYVSYTGSITNTDATQTGRVLRSHPPSSCASPNSGSVNADGFVRHYDTYVYTNTTGFATCVTIRVSSNCGDNTTGSAAYLNTFNPANLAQNYLGDYGETGGPQYSYSVNLPAGQAVVIVVHELSPNLGCNTYTVEINPCTVGGPTATPTTAVTSTNTPIPTNTGQPTSTMTPIPTNTGQVPTVTATSTNTSQPSATETSTPGSGSPTATPTACTIQFADVLQGNTFYESIHCLACRGIINGYPCGGDGEPCNGTSDPYFRPSNNITRGQLAKVVSQSAGFSEPVTGQDFEDVAPGTTFYDYIGRLVIHDVMGGYPCGVDPNEPCGNGNLPYFRPGANATRGQLTKIVSNAAGFSDPDPSTFTFTDVPPGSTFHLYVERLLINRPGAMNGYPCSSPAEPCDDQNRPYFRPSNTLSRGQTSKIVANTFYPGCVTPSK